MCVVSTHRSSPRAGAPVIALLLLSFGWPAGGAAAQEVRPSPVPAATAPSDSVVPWEVHVEIGIAASGTWADGGSGPTVRSGGGAQFGVQIVREVPSASARNPRRRLFAGGAARISAKSVSLREAGDAWDGGTISQGDLVAVLSWRPSHTSGTRFGADAGIGLAYLSASDDIAPFRDAPSVAPLGEIGVALMRATNTLEGRPYAIFVRVSALRLAPADVADAPEPATAGFVTQLVLGLRVGR